MLICWPVLQPIRMQTCTDKVELAVMHVLETDPSYADMAVMCQRNPLHTFMFDSRGKLLNANKAAFEGFQSDPPSTLASHALPQIYSAQDKPVALQCDHKTFKSPN